jgi:hypothetical protein
VRGKALTPIVTGLLLATLLSGCTSAPTPQYPVKKSLGITVAALKKQFGTGTSLGALDVSASFGKSPEYEGLIDDQLTYVVIGICSDRPFLSEAHSIQAAIAPQSVVTSDVIRKAKRGQYRNLLTCEKFQKYHA